MNNNFVKGSWQEILDWAQNKSINMLHYCTGCGAIELPPTMTSRYDMSRFGIGPAATPRQADLLLVTGYLSTKTLRRLIYTYEQMQAPKFVVGFGSCTINGGMYWDSYNTIKQLDKYLPVEMYIAGCMPRPEAILDGLLKLKKMINNGEADGYQRYQDNLEFYHQNQEAVLGEVQRTQ
ncbi:Membrane bound protein complex subunit mbxJ /NADH dehydrogenase subunit B [Halanaerobium saccharolyticum]|uniref:Membrane bound protein complex subunit mbxJ /NADH dehydrogenase subunit B n=1 Tax=Halanaerobium saccharolyticum TaxID=43595 RepID=A0A4R6LKV3_9FIRM|nr:NADH-quinone oxidoreductase subunit B [Halanaerobium saccharolyticum]TDO84611.1 Membrane bound protein complex subunit mbxJ /NADH dehydrogenase subunit B [Halanaerobium saccharolyticum]